VLRHCPDLTEAQGREVIRTWVKNGVLTKESYLDPVDRETCMGLRLDQSKRPGDTTEVGLPKQKAAKSSQSRPRFRRVDDAPDD
jgi:hypothetical protein